MVTRRKDPLLNQLFDKGSITLDDLVQAVELVQIRNFRSQSQTIVNTVAAVAQGNTISLFDMNGRLLERLNIENDTKVLAIAQPANQDDMSFAILSDNSTLYLIKLQIRDVFTETQTLNETAANPDGSNPPPGIKRKPNKQ